MKTVIDLNRKLILLIGSSSGMGAETAILCSELGARVILVARREDKLKEVMAKLKGEGHRYYSFDLSELTRIESFIKQVITDAGSLDGFVYCAGIPGTRPLKLMKPKALQQVMDINFNSFVEVVRCVTKRNAFNEGMSIVGISSVSSTKGGLGKIAYCASKAAMDAAVRSMAKELAPYKIRVNTVCPGLIDTAIYDKIKNDATDSHDLDMRIERQYLGVGKPIDVASVITFLLSDAARMMTGLNIGVDGGLLSS